MFGLRGHQWLVVALLVACGHVVVSVLALSAVWSDATRPPTSAELRRAATAEVAQRWQRWPVGRIFPERLPYSPDGSIRDPADGQQTEIAGRVGVAPASGCAEVIEPRIAVLLQAQGCRAVLRATYLDQLQGIVVTVGIAVFPDEWAAYRARLDVPGEATTLRSMPFPNTVTARFSDAARQSGSAERAGPYIVLTTSGYTDGRPAAATPKKREEIFDVAPQLATSIARSMSSQKLPDCTSREWMC